MTTIPLELVQKLQVAQQVVILTGAGVSAESGIPTFRQAQTGLWARYDPTELATPQAFQQNPRLVWEWYAWRRELVAQAKPNPAHLALVQMQQYVSQFTLITQNIDGLHQQAGSQAVIELHGNIHRTKCFQQGHLVANWPPTDAVPPHCPYCGGLLRPDVVWFGENLSNSVLELAYEASKQCDMFFSIGTSSLVYPAAWLPSIALQATRVEINPQSTPLTSQVHFALRGSAAELLPKLVDWTWVTHESSPTS
jgi:NAD-dependent deacetylase